MGIDINGATLLLGCKAQGVQFAETITIGRQFFHVTPSVFQRILNDSGMSEVSAEHLIAARDGFAEPFFHLLGATKVDSIDASSYEQAAIIHDLNEPIPDKYRSAYTAVIDGGSLEHIFNFPTAIRNCIEMLKPGGHFIGISPANNMLGHGFYQFSPELYYRIFSPVNGFDDCNVFLYNDKQSRQTNQANDLFYVVDPVKANSRVTLKNCHPTYLFVVAHKNVSTSLFNPPPQQSDYENLSWRNKTPTEYSTNISRSPIKSVLRPIIPNMLRKLRTNIRYFNNPIGDGNPALFHKTKFPKREV